MTTDSIEQYRWGREVLDRKSRRGEGWTICEEVVGKEALRRAIAVMPTGCM